MIRAFCPDSFRIGLQIPVIVARPNFTGNPVEMFKSQPNPVAAEQAWLLKSAVCSAPGGAAILNVFPRIEWPGSTTKPEVEDWLG
jgi:hypothetical protein